MSHAQVLPDAVWSKKAVLVVGWPVVGRDGYRANSRCSAYFTSLQAEDLSGETSKSRQKGDDFSNEPCWDSVKFFRFPVSAAPFKTLQFVHFCGSWELVKDQLRLLSLDSLPSPIIFFKRDCYPRLQPHDRLNFQFWGDIDNFPKLLWQSVILPESTWKKTDTGQRYCLAD